MFSMIARLFLLVSVSLNGGAAAQQPPLCYENSWGDETTECVPKSLWYKEALQTCESSNMDLSEFDLTRPCDVPGTLPESSSEASFRSVQFRCCGVSEPPATEPPAACICTDEWVPVCAFVGSSTVPTTVSNECVARCENLEIAHEGACEPLPPVDPVCNLCDAGFRFEAHKQVPDWEEGRVCGAELAWACNPDLSSEQLPGREHLRKHCCVPEQECRGLPWSTQADLAGHCQEFQEVCNDCIPFSYCIDQWDDNCENAPKDCGQRCSEYLPCLDAAAGEPCLSEDKWRTYALHACDSSGMEVSHFDFTEHCEYMSEVTGTKMFKAVDVKCCRREGGPCDACPADWAPVCAVERGSGFTALENRSEVCGKSCDTPGVVCHTTQHSLEECEAVCAADTECRGFQAPDDNNGFHGWCVTFNYFPDATAPSTHSCHVGQTTYVKGGSGSEREHTIDNACYADCKGLEIIHEGECKPQPGPECFDQYWGPNTTPAAATCHSEAFWRFEAEATCRSQSMDLREFALKDGEGCDAVESSVPVADGGIGATGVWFQCCAAPQPEPECRRLPWDDSSIAPGHCLEFHERCADCAAFSYCIDEWDDNCENAPKDCGQRCSEYLPCLDAVAAGSGEDYPCLPAARWERYAHMACDSSGQTVSHFEFTESCDGAELFRAVAVACCDRPPHPCAACPEHWAPVCASGGPTGAPATVHNACAAGCKGMHILYEGECRPSHPPACPDAKLFTWGSAAAPGTHVVSCDDALPLCEDCLPFAYCAHDPDERCDDAPRDCGARCAPYLPCLSSTASPAVVPPPESEEPCMEAAKWRWYANTTCAGRGKAMADFSVDESAVCGGAVTAAQPMPRYAGAAVTCCAGGPGGCVPFASRSILLNCDDEALQRVRGGLGEGPYELMATVCAGMAALGKEATQLRLGDDGAQACPFTVTSDAEPPVLEGCPEYHIEVPTAPGRRTGRAQWNVQVHDNVGVASVDTWPAGVLQGGEFPLGDTQVRIVAADVAGNEASCEFTVHVFDAEAPVFGDAVQQFGCGADVEVATLAGAKHGAVRIVKPAVWDNVAVTEVYYEVAGAGLRSAGGRAARAGLDLDFGSDAFFLTGSDGSDGSDGSFLAGSDGSDGEFLTGSDGGSDGSDGSAGGEGERALFGLGESRVTWTARDAAGNQNKCAFNVRVRDDETPTFLRCPRDLLLAADEDKLTTVSGVLSAPVQWDAPEAVDNVGVESLEALVEVGGVVLGTAEPGQLLRVGTSVVRYAATDASGNTARCDFSVTLMARVEAAVLDASDDVTQLSNGKTLREGALVLGKKGKRKTSVGLRFTSAGGHTLPADAVVTRAVIELELSHTSKKNLDITVRGALDLPAYDDAVEQGRKLHKLPLTDASGRMAVAKLTPAGTRVTSGNLAPVVQAALAAGGVTADAAARAGLAFVLRGEKGDALGGQKAYALDQQAVKAARLRLEFTTGALPPKLSQEMGILRAASRRGGAAAASAAYESSLALEFGDDEYAPLGWTPSTLATATAGDGGDGGVSLLAVAGGAGALLVASVVAVLAVVSRRRRRAAAAAAGAAVQTVTVQPSASVATHKLAPPAGTPLRPAVVVPMLMSDVHAFDI